MIDLTCFLFPEMPFLPHELEFIHNYNTVYPFIIVFKNWVKVHDPQSLTLIATVIR